MHPLPVLANLNVGGALLLPPVRRTLWRMFRLSHRPIAAFYDGGSLNGPFGRQAFPRIPEPRLGVWWGYGLLGLHLVVVVVLRLIAQFSFFKLYELGDEPNIGRDAMSSFGDVRVGRLECPCVGVDEVG